MSGVGKFLVEVECELDTRQVAALDALALATGRSRESLIEDAVRWFVTNLGPHLPPLPPRKS